jgi:hypothetical protein
MTGDAIKRERSPDWEAGGRAMAVPVSQSAVYQDAGRRGWFGWQSRDGPPGKLSVPTVP